MLVPSRDRLHCGNRHLTTYSSEMDGSRMNRNRSTWRVHWIILQCVFAALAWIPSPIWAQGKKAKEDAKRVVYKADGESQKNFLGKVITEAQDGGMLLLGTDGRIALVPKKEVISSEDVEDGWSVSSSDQLSAKLKEEFPKDFKIHTTKHYLFCYNTSDEYAKWTGALFERLHRGFYNIGAAEAGSCPNRPSRWWSWYSIPKPVI